LPHERFETLRLRPSPAYVDECKPPVTSALTGSRPARRQVSKFCDGAGSRGRRPLVADELTRSGALCILDVWRKRATDPGA
jgi:hypothetical protein